MSTDSLSKQELMASGWTERLIDAALDEPDEVGPAGHWLNTCGKPYYHPDRVAVAAYRIGLTDQQPAAAIWDVWVPGAKPTALPLMTFDFHRMAKACKPGARRHIRGLRIAHPVMGRLPGTAKEEAAFIGMVLMALAQKTHGIELADQQDLDRFFEDIAAGAISELGDPWPMCVVARKARRSSYLSKAVGLPAQRKFLNVLALMHVGWLRLNDGQTCDVIRWLIRAPRMRFDRAVSQVGLNERSHDSKSLH
jgi:hypothetical protein